MRCCQADRHQAVPASLSPFPRCQNVPRHSSVRTSGFLTESSSLSLDSPHSKYTGASLNGILRCSRRVERGGEQNDGFVLRLSTKYFIEHPRTQCLARLIHDWPTTLADWGRREAAAMDANGCIYRSHRRNLESYLLGRCTRHHVDQEQSWLPFQLHSMAFQETKGVDPS
ncbi:hypothetical protein EV363DRAFT_1356099 [Boletus edulis]|uniref:Uncharacterized protein n=1 Tax=Boletus edulis BED1 TaxID=1328754 RepID=A0AAD4BH61_BOLED|nr:hypothetical protein EV363DRAFT_1356099 [Boletus edulis]KAF8429964.1 hypothetical protein L210DRAFT_3562909 [Boletus edulis BED1]